MFFGTGEGWGGAALGEDSGEIVVAGVGDGVGVA